ncbi:MAG: cation:proton antiporter [Candidatus Omnitrophica bacterium]|nr:cation:proton antiporter [Candidatus Omnitrophota bacterium]
MLCGLGAQWISWRFNIPGIALFLIIGFVAGPLMGWVEPGFLRNDLLYATVSTFVAVILFEGSLQLKWRELWDSGSAIWHLVFMGGLITMVLGALGAGLILGLEPRLAVLLGAILIVTGPTVVLPLLKQIRPAGKLTAILKWEGIAIDPLGALVAVLIYEIILSEGPRQIFGIFTIGILKTLLLGSFIGLAAAGIILLAFRKYLVPENLRHPFVLTVVVAAFIVSALLENEPTGFLSVTVMGIALANQRLIPIRGVLVFKEMLKSLILPALFIILAARLPLSDLPLINGRVFIFLLFLILIVRPLAVFLSSRSSGLHWKEKLFLSFIAPRGIVAAAVASLFSDRLVQAGMKGAGELVILVFFVVSSTVIFYAIVSPLLAHFLKLSRPRSSGILVFGANKFSIALSLALKEQGSDVLIVDRNEEQIAAAESAGLEVIKEDIFSEEVFEVVEERGLGRFLALTQNPEANSLAISHFRHLTEPGELYQLTPPRKSKLRAGHHLVGRLLFDEEMDFYVLQDLTEKGAIAKLIGADQGHKPEACPILFSSDGKGKVAFFTTEHHEGSFSGRDVFGFRDAREVKQEIS